MIRWALTFIVALLPCAAQDTAKRTELNLQGQTDTASGESRRNENIQFNPIDNNALKELNVRMGTTATIVPEFRIDRNYFGAEFGKPAAKPAHIAPVKIDALHGDLSEWHNNSIFSARSFFQDGSVKPAHSNEYGFRVTAPVWEGGFFSLDGSQQKIRGSVNGNVLVPLASERTPLTNDPALRPIVLRFLAAYPAQLPNRTDISPHALNTNAAQSININDAGARLDQHLGANRFFAQHRITEQQVQAFQFVSGQNPNTNTKSQAARLTWARSWNARTSTNFSLGFDRLHSRILPSADGPQVTVSGLEQFGAASSLPIDRTQNLFQYAGQAIRTGTKHTLTAGFAIMRRQINGSEYSSQRGVITFQNDFGHDAITNLRMGLPSRYSVGLGDPHRGFRDWALEFYAGDRWAVTPNLTVHYGLRYQPVTAPTEVNGLNEAPWHCNCRDFAPRLGFAWRAPGRWGVLRAAYGLHYGEIFPVTYQQLRFNPPRMLKLEIHNPDLIHPLAGADLSPTARSTVFGFPSSLLTPYSHQYNFTWEPQLARNWKLQLGYVGSRSNRLLYMWYTNRGRPVPGIDQTNGTVNDRRLDATHFDIRRITNMSRGYYDAARVSLIFPRWRGLTFDSSYWLSKAIDLGGNYTNPAANTDNGQVRSQSEGLVNGDLKGPSPFDQSHAFLLRGTYEVRRFTFSAVLLAKTGQPFDVLSGSDGPGFGNVDGSNGDRPNLLDPSILGRTLGNPDTSRLLLPRSAFSFIRPTETRGNLGHDVFRRGGIHNLNAAVARSFKLGGDKSITLRAESINFLNTPQFAEPGKELTSPNFGMITNTLNDGRTFRFLLRFGF
jgi:hypothetical protein